MRLLSTLLLSFSFLMSYGQKEKIQSLVDSIRTASGYPGVVYAYVDSAGNSSAFCAGYADQEKNEEMTKDHRLHGGSTGKTVVSTLIMQLVDEGALTLEDKVETYLGNNKWFARIPNAGELTIKHLLRHSAGIQRYEFKEAFLNELAKDKDRVWKPEELIYFVLDDEPLFAAGEGFTYADTNYILLGMIIEKVKGQPFYQLANDQIISPLGITSFIPTNTDKVPLMAQGYYTSGSQYSLGFASPFLIDGVAQNNMQFEWAGGGYAYATMDYAMLLKKIFEGEAFDMDKLRETFHDYIDAPEIGCQYGMGVMKFNFPGLGEFLGHAGFFPGYNSIGLYHPETKTAFAMQINTTEGAQLQRFFADFLRLTSRTLPRR